MAFMGCSMQCLCLCEAFPLGSPGGWADPPLEQQQAWRAAWFSLLDHWCVRCFWNEVLGHRAPLVASFHPPCILCVCALKVCHLLRLAGSRGLYDRIVINCFVVLGGGHCIFRPTGSVLFFSHWFPWVSPRLVMYRQGRERRKTEINIFFVNTDRMPGHVRYIIIPDFCLFFPFWTQAKGAADFVKHHSPSARWHAWS